MRRGGGGGDATVVRDSNRDWNTGTQDPVDTNKVKKVIVGFKGGGNRFFLRSGLSA